MDNTKLILTAFGALAEIGGMVYFLKVKDLKERWETGALMAAVLIQIIIAWS